MVDVQSLTPEFYTMPIPARDGLNKLSFFSRSNPTAGFLECKTEIKSISEILWAELSRGGDMVAIL